MYVYSDNRGCVLVSGLHEIPSNVIWVELGFKPDQSRFAEWKIMNGQLVTSGDNLAVKKIKA